MAMAGVGKPRPYNDYIRGPTTPDLLLRRCVGLAGALAPQEVTISIYRADDWFRIKVGRHRLVHTEWKFLPEHPFLLTPVFWQHCTRSIERHSP